MANSSNVTLRLLQNGGVDRPITYEELDNNFVELKNVIDEYNDFILNVLPEVQKETILDLSKSVIDKQLYYGMGVNDVFTIDGEYLTVPQSTLIYQSDLIECVPYGAHVYLEGHDTGGIRVQIFGYDENGDVISTSSDNDYVVNGSNRSFSSSPTFAPVSNSETDITIDFTDAGLAKAKFYTLAIQSTGLGQLKFIRLVFKG